MSRRKEPCEYCTEEQYESFGTNHQLCIEWYPFNGYIGICSFSNSEEESERTLEYNIPLNYCPVCGRRLMI